MSNYKEINNKLIKFFFKKKISDNLDLFGSGNLDSIRLIELIIFIEKKFKIKISEKDLTIKKFNTIKKISKIILEKI
jgi:acyl carrier protein